MGTGTKYVNITNKRLMGVADWNTRFLQYMTDYIVETAMGTLDTSFFKPVGVSLSGDGNDSFSIDFGQPTIAADGLGHFLNIHLSQYTGIKFENESGGEYYVALHHCTIPRGIQINPVHGNPEYVEYENQIGEKAEPNFVTDNGGTITFIVDDVTQTGISCAGRTVYVYKKIPAQGAINESIAVEACTVSWAGGFNIITTTGTLGQTTVSTTVSDYEVVLYGPSVRRDDDMTLVAGYVYVGGVLGSGAGTTPTVFDTGGQRVIPYSWTSALLDGLPQDFYPSDDDTYSLGTPSRRWATIYATGLSFDGDLIPETDNAQDIGTNLLQWRYIYAHSLVVSGAGNTAGVDSDLIPKANNSRALGSSSYKWSDIFSYDVDTVTLKVSDTAGVGGVTDNLIPSADATHNLGASLYAWHALYIEHIVCRDTASFAWAAGEGIASDFVPATTLAYDIGAPSYLWGTIYAEDLIIDGDSTTGDLFINGRLQLDYNQVSPLAGVSSDLRPNVDDTYDLGSATYRWYELRTGNLHLLDTAGRGAATSIVPTSDDAYDLGAASYRWNQLYTMQLSLGYGTGNGVISNFDPKDTDSYTLGNTGHRWNLSHIKDLFLTSLDVNDGGSSGVGVVSSLIPGSVDTWSLGDSSYKWYNIYSSGTISATILTVSTASSEGIGSTLLPTASDTYDLGSSTRYWNDIYSNNIYYKTTFTTFDDFDDLALIEAYGPIEGNEGRTSDGIRLADPETVPWPMIGPINPESGIPYIDLGRSMMFLVGAIKRLYQIHKEEIGALKAEMERIQCAGDSSVV